jgi:hypothetical protein
MKDTTPLANINFSAAAKPKVLTQITNVNQFKPNEDITGVCTSLEEWALRILKPNQAVQLQELVDTDSETASRIKEYRRRIYRNSISQQQILFLLLTTLKWRMTILQNLTLTQRETKTCQSTN